MNEITLFGKTTFRNEMRRFGIKADDRRRHMYLIGKTGMGKSTLLENMIIDDINAGRGLAVTDPHGDLAEKIIEYIPSHRINDVIYFNPGDIDHPIAFNVIEHVDPHFRHLVASGLLGVFKKLWADSWGPRLEYTLRNAILAVLDYPEATLLAVVRMLSDKDFRKKIITHIKDPVVKSFWTKEFASYTDKFASEAVAPIQNKVGQFLSASLIRNIVGQVKSSINVREIMDEKKILIMNLSKGLIGEDNMQLLGAMMITKIQLAAMSRVDIPESTRQDFYLYVDEFQNFATESFANILSEARKYRLNLIMAHQYIEQLDEKVRDAVFGNVGSFTVFRVGAQDAETLVPEFTPTFDEQDIVNIPKYEFYCKLMIDGVASDPFSAKGLPPKTLEQKTNVQDKIIKASREKYSMHRHIIEEKIAKWHEEPEEGVKNQPPFTKVKKEFSPEKKYIYPDRTSRTTQYFNTQDDTHKSNIQKDTNIINCSNCNKTTMVTFKPDGLRPIYCKECLLMQKELKKNKETLRIKQKQEEIARFNQKKENIENSNFKLNLSTLNKTNNNLTPINQALRSNPIRFGGATNKQATNVTQNNASIIKPKKTQESNSTIGELNEGEEININ